MPKILKSFVFQQPGEGTDNYIDGGPTRAGLEELRAKLNAAPYVFETIAQAQAESFIEPECCVIHETGLFYLYNSTSTATDDGKKCLAPIGGGRLIAVGGAIYKADEKKIYFGDNSVFHEDNDRFGIGTDTPEYILHAKSTSDNFLEIENTTSNIRGKFGVTDGFTGIWHNDDEPSNVDGQFATNGAGTSVRASSLVQLKTNASSGLMLNLSGDVGIGTTTQTARLHTKSSTSDSSSYALKVDDSSDSRLLSVRNDGPFRIKGPLYMDTPMYCDISFSTTSLSSGIATNPDIGLLDSTTIDISLFDGGVTEEEVSSCVELQHNYKEGTDLLPHVHWYATDNNTGNVKWQLEYVIVSVNPGSTVSSSTIISVIAATTGIAWTLITSNFPVIVGTNLKIGDQIHFRLFRIPSDASDTYNSDAATATFGFHYQVDSFGSATTTTK